LTTKTSRAWLQLSTPCASFRARRFELLGTQGSRTPQQATQQPPDDDERPSDQTEQPEYEGRTPKQQQQKNGYYIDLHHRTGPQQYPFLCIAVSSRFAG